ncbi:unnamed protein product [Phytophthora lilii]|uniref:Unnamed protein product n=1 Tax=Phytophthora lilii TaxID=2077276 RepID=A0A9W6WIC5_9STRA|nr:unnamed protein product [Phytophthora lilii]
MERGGRRSARQLGLHGGAPQEEAAPAVPPVQVDALRRGQRHEARAGDLQVSWGCRWSDVARANRVLCLACSNESRSELVFLLSLADAVLSFESDNANIVMEKCFCVEVRTWKKKNTVRLQPQGFIFYEESQARMLLWVKCIHLAIKRATTLDSELFRSPSTSSSVEPVRRFSDSDESRIQLGTVIPSSCEDSHCASNATSPGSSPTSSSSFAAARDKLTQRLVIDPATRIVSAGRTMLTPTRSSSVTGERQPNRWGGLFSHDKQQQTRSPMSSTATDTPSSPIESNTASPKPSPWKRSTKATTDVSSETVSGSAVDPVASPRSQSFRATSPTTKPSHADATPVTSAVKSSTIDKEEQGIKELKPVLPVNTEPVTSGPESSKQNDPGDVSDELEPVALRVLAVMLIVAVIAGVSDASVFLPLALAGALAHFSNHHECFSSWTLSSVVVYLSTSCNVLFGIGAASAFLYIWGYANFKTQRRRRTQRKASVHFRDTRTRQATIKVDHFEVDTTLVLMSA